MGAQLETWCQADGHADYELFRDFNAWIDEGSIDLDLPNLRKLSGVGLPHPSKAFFAGDRKAYDQAFLAYRSERRAEVLSRDHLLSLYGDTDGKHWFERNEARFDQLVECLEARDVVPFIGAGVSEGGGYPTWTQHLREQGRTAGIPTAMVEEWLAQGKYEEIIAHIEQQRGLRVFALEIRDTFGKTGSLEEITLRLSEMFNDTLITTNYDSLLEQVFATDGESRVQVINGVTAMTLPDPDKTTIIKIHGDFKDPTHCILGKSQYDAAYGETALDLDRPIPRMLARYYRSNSLLFLGCSLRSDRTLQVFQAAMKDAGDTFLPPHFALVQAPESLAGLGDRNAELANLGIAAIWYPGGQHDMVEEILGLAQADLNFRKSRSSRKPASIRS